MDELEPLGREIGRHQSDTCRVPARVAEAGDEASRDRINAEIEDDRNGRGRRLDRKCRRRADRSITVT
jgi:hypothetical protein